MKKLLFYISFLFATCLTFAQVTQYYNTPVEIAPTSKWAVYQNTRVYDNGSTGNPTYDHGENPSVSIIHIAKSSSVSNYGYTTFSRHCGFVVFDIAANLGTNPHAYNGTIL
jgi:hypothetical protein